MTLSPVETNQPYWIDPSVGNYGYGPGDPRPAAAGQGKGGDEFWGKDGFGFDDFLDLINPLHHLPLIGAIYRAITGDEISTGARIIGGGLFGGPIGMAIAMTDAAVNDATGNDIGSHVIAMAMGKDPSPKTDQSATQMAAVSQQPAPQDPKASQGPQASPDAALTIKSTPNAAAMPVRRIPLAMGAIGNARASYGNITPVAAPNASPTASQPASLPGNSPLSAIDRSKIPLFGNPRAVGGPKNQASLPIISPQAWQMLMQSIGGKRGAEAAKLGAGPNAVSSAFSTALPMAPPRQAEAANVPDSAQQLPALRRRDASLELRSVLENYAGRRKLK